MKQFCYGEIDIEKEMMDDLYNLIINKSTIIPAEFYLYLERLELLYTPEIVQNENFNNQLLKEIIYTLYLIYNSRFKYLINCIKRNELVNLYNICKDAEKKEKINNFIAYYERSIINKYTEI